MAANPFQPRKSIGEAVDMLQAMLKKIDASNFVYCETCQDVRPIKHRCECLACGMLLDECECESEEGDDDGK